jgi:hypothetical protein
MDLEEHIESVDLNPVKCNPEKCIIADARIMLMKSAEADFIERPFGAQNQIDQP